MPWRRASRAGGLGEPPPQHPRRRPHGPTVPPLRAPRRLDDDVRPAGAGATPRQGDEDLVPVHEGGELMRALSLLQPWASLVILALKRVETRSWEAPERAKGRIAIHASKALRRAEADLFHESPFREAFGELGIESVDELPLGAILGTVGLSGCWPVEHFLGKISARERAFGNYSNDEGQRYGWVLERPMPIDNVIFCKGSLGLWTVPADVLAQIPEAAR